ncbi:MAG: quinoprotein dehydrogenase-associated putative ABC transporter substrate-binding protein [Rhodocyclales bacterium]|nr:quinoprotein dehydrogenase-associated putative ABC transporter substrate-binding protein [Rhodocyclales bacterium]
MSVSRRFLRPQGLLIALVAVFLAALPRCVAAAEEGGVLRVCADPNNLPLSHRNGAGFENRIAELFARDLGWKLEYAWMPQRMGFIRNSLRARNEGSDSYRCDLVMGLPVGFELAATTAPYYRSTWVLVYVRGQGLDTVAAPDDLLKLDPVKLQALRLGAFGMTPPVDWLARHHLLDQIVPYRPQTGDPEQYTGEIVDKDLRAGKIDVAFVWGPIAGYFASRDPERRLAVVPFAPDPAIKFDYAMAMGVRFGERQWKTRVEQLIDRNREGIRAILAAYGVPLLDDAQQVAQPAR